MPMRKPKLMCKLCTLSSFPFLIFSSWRRSNGGIGLGQVDPPAPRARALVDWRQKQSQKKNRFMDALLGPVTEEMLTRTPHVVRARVYACMLVLTAVLQCASLVGHELKTQQGIYRYRYSSTKAEKTVECRLAVPPERLLLPSLPSAGTERVSASCLPFPSLPRMLVQN